MEACQSIKQEKHCHEEGFQAESLLYALELDSEWLSAFESIIAKIALPELELISIWGIVLVIY